MKKERNRSMKCPRCKQTMKRRKKENGYFYYCPRCKFTVGNKTYQTDRESVADSQQDIDDEQ